MLRQLNKDEELEDGYLAVMLYIKDFQRQRQGQYKFDLQDDWG